jgi:hypothetical protein
VPEQLRRRRAAASWSQRHRARLDRIFGVHDPLKPVSEPLTDTELDSWRAAWRHLHGLRLPAVVPRRVVATGQAHRADSAS